MQILLVEDQAEIAHMYSIGLEAAGHEVTIAGDGESGLAQIVALRPHLVLLDIGLPGIGGLDVLEFLWRASAGERQDLPVAMLTNYTDSAFKEQAVSMGALDYLVKSRVRPSHLAALLLDWEHRRVAWPEDYDWALLGELSASASPPVN